MIRAQRGQIGIPARSLNGLLLTWVGRLGWPFPRLVVLRVHGRRTGRLHRTPLLILPHAGERYLVAPRGRTSWALNLRAAGWGELLRGRRRERIAAVDVTGAEREAVLAAYLRSYGWLTRRLFGVERRPDARTIAAIAERHPVFRLEARP